MNAEVTEKLNPGAVVKPLCFCELCVPNWAAVESDRQRSKATPTPISVVLTTVNGRSTLARHLAACDTLLSLAHS